MNKCNLRPDEESYQFSVPTGLLSATLDGGPPRVRADVQGSWTTLKCSWTGDSSVLSYMQQIHRYTEAHGGEHFLIDLIMDSGLIAEREVTFQPGSFGLSGIKGDQYTVSATLLVIPDLNADATWPVDSDFQDGILAAESGALLGT